MLQVANPLIKHLKAFPLHVVPSTKLFKAEVILADVPACASVVHVIDTVLIPKAALPYIADLLSAQKAAKVGGEELCVYQGGEREKGGREEEEERGKRRGLTGCAAGAAHSSQHLLVPCI
jgi:hypothetical protein